MIDFWVSIMNKTENYLFDLAFEAIICTGTVYLRDIHKIKKIAREYYEIALKNDETRNSLSIPERQLAES